MTEPIESLKKHGWAYGDIPAASNVNWVLNRIAKDADAFSKDFSAFKSMATEELTHLPQRDERLRRFALLLREDLNLVLEESDRHGHALQVICENLKGLERQLKAFHAVYQPMPWPEIHRREPRPVRDELSDIFDEIDRRRNNG